jgi:hypothetical protein
LHRVPADRIWTAKDDAVTLPGWLGIPGLRHSIGLAHWWHFTVNLLWTVNGVESPDWTGLPFFLLAMAVILAAWLWATPFTIKHARLVQKTGGLVIGGLKGIAERWDPTSQLTEKDISPHFWPNHHLLPNSAALPIITCASAGS